MVYNNLQMVYLLFFMLLLFTGCGTSSLPSPPIPANTLYLVAKPTTGLAPLTVGFKLYAPAGIDITSNSWNLGDGTTMKDTVELNHTYTKAGVYEVSASTGTSEFVKKTRLKKTTEYINICVFDPLKPERYEYMGTMNIESDIDAFAIDTVGVIYIVSNDSSSVKIYSSDGTFMKSWNLETNTSSNNLFERKDIALDTNNNVYVLTRSTNAIQKFDANSNLLKQWNSCNTQEEGTNCENDLAKPYSLVIDRNNSIYILEASYSDNGYVQQILKFDNNGNFLSKLTLPDNDSFDHIAIDPSGNIYVALSYAHNDFFINVYSPNGNLIKQWLSYGNLDGSIKYITGLTIDDSGNIFIADGFLRVAHKFDASSNFVTKFGVCENNDIALPGPIHVLKDGTVYFLSYAARSIAVFKKSSYNLK